jgi:phosphopantetheine adenylyltransferase
MHHHHTQPNTKDVRVAPAIVPRAESTVAAVLVAFEDFSNAVLQYKNAAEEYTIAEFNERGLSEEIRQYYIKLDDLIKRLPAADFKGYLERIFREKYRLFLVQKLLIRFAELRKALVENQIEDVAAKKNVISQLYAFIFDQRQFPEKLPNDLLQELIKAWELAKPRDIKSPTELSRSYSEPVVAADFKYRYIVTLGGVIESTRLIADSLEDLDKDLRELLKESNPQQIRSLQDKMEDRLFDVRSEGNVDLDESETHGLRFIQKLNAQLQRVDVIETQLHFDLLRKELISLLSGNSAHLVTAKIDAALLSYSRLLSKHYGVLPVELHEPLIQKWLTIKWRYELLQRQGVLKMQTPLPRLSLVEDVCGIAPRAQSPKKGWFDKRETRVTRRAKETEAAHVSCVLRLIGKDGEPISTVLQTGLYFPNEQAPKVWGRFCGATTGTLVRQFRDIDSAKIRVCNTLLPHEQAVPIKGSLPATDDDLKAVGIHHIYRPYICDHSCVMWLGKDSAGKDIFAPFGVPQLQQAVAFLYDEQNECPYNSVTNCHGGASRSGMIVVALLSRYLVGSGEIRLHLSNGVCAKECCSLTEIVTYVYNIRSQAASEAKSTLAAYGKNGETAKRIVLLMHWFNLLANNPQARQQIFERKEHDGIRADFREFFAVLINPSQAERERLFLGENHQYVLAFIRVWDECPEGLKQSLYQYLATKDCSRLLNTFLYLSTEPDSLAILEASRIFAHLNDKARYSTLLSMRRQTSDDEFLTVQWTRLYFALPRANRSKFRKQIETYRKNNGERRGIYKTFAFTILPHDESLRGLRAGQVAALPDARPPDVEPVRRLSLSGSLVFEETSSVRSDGSSEGTVPANLCGYIQELVANDLIWVNPARSYAVQSVVLIMTRLIRDKYKSAPYDCAELTEQYSELLQRAIGHLGEQVNLDDNDQESLAQYFCDIVAPESPLLTEVEEEGEAEGFVLVLKEDLRSILYRWAGANVGDHPELVSDKQWQILEALGDRRSRENQSPDEDEEQLFVGIATSVCRNPDGASDKQWLLLNNLIDKRNKVEQQADAQESKLFAGIVQHLSEVKEDDADVNSHEKQLAEKLFHRLSRHNVHDFILMSDPPDFLTISVARPTMCVWQKDDAWSYTTVYPDKRRREISTFENAEAIAAINAATQGKEPQHGRYNFVGGDQKALEANLKKESEYAAQISHIDYVCQIPARMVNQTVLGPVIGQMRDEEFAVVFHWTNRLIQLMQIIKEAMRIEHFASEDSKSIVASLISITGLAHINLLRTEIRERRDGRVKILGYALNKSPSDCALFKKKCDMSCEFFRGFITGKGQIFFTHTISTMVMLEYVAYFGQVVRHYQGMLHEEASTCARFQAYAALIKERGTSINGHIDAGRLTPETAVLLEAKVEQFTWMTLELPRFIDNVIVAAHKAVHDNIDRVETLTIQVTEKQECYNRKKVDDPNSCGGELAALDVVQKDLKAAKENLAASENTLARFILHKLSHNPSALTKELKAFIIAQRRHSEHFRHQSEVSPTTLALSPTETPLLRTSDHLRSLLKLDYEGTERTFLAQFVAIISVASMQEIQLFAGLEGDDANKLIRILDLDYEQDSSFAHFQRLFVIGNCIRHIRYDGDFTPYSLDQFSNLSALAEAQKQAVTIQINSLGASVQTLFFKISGWPAEDIFLVQEEIDTIGHKIVLLEMQIATLRQIKTLLTKDDYDLTKIDKRFDYIKDTFTKIEDKKTDKVLTASSYNKLYIQPLIGKINANNNLCPNIALFLKRFVDRMQRQFLGDESTEALPSLRLLTSILHYIADPDPDGCDLCLMSSVPDDSTISSAVRDGRKISWVYLDGEIWRYVISTPDEPRPSGVMNTAAVAAINSVTAARQPSGDGYYYKSSDKKEVDELQRRLRRLDTKYCANTHALSVAKPATPAEAATKKRDKTIQIQDSLALEQEDYFVLCLIMLREVDKLPMVKRDSELRVELRRIIALCFIQIFTEEDQEYVNKQGDILPTFLDALCHSDADYWADLIINCFQSSKFDLLTTCMNYLLQNPADLERTVVAPICVKSLEAFATNLEVSEQTARIIYTWVELRCIGFQTISTRLSLPNFVKFLVFNIGRIQTSDCVRDASATLRSMLRFEEVRSYLHDIFLSGIEREEFSILSILARSDEGLEPVCAAAWPFIKELYEYRNPKQHQRPWLISHDTFRSLVSGLYFLRYCIDKKMAYLVEAYIQTISHRDIKAVLEELDKKHPLRSKLDEALRGPDRTNAKIPKGVLETNTRLYICVDDARSGLRTLLREEINADDKLKEKQDRCVSNFQRLLDNALSELGGITQQKSECKEIKYQMRRAMFDTVSGYGFASPEFQTGSKIIEEIDQKFGLKSFSKAVIELLRGNSRLRDNQDRFTDELQDLLLFRKEWTFIPDQMERAMSALKLPKFEKRYGSLEQTLVRSDLIRISLAKIFSRSEFQEPSKCLRYLDGLWKYSLVTAATDSTRNMTYEIKQENRLKQIMGLVWAEACQALCDRNIPGIHIYTSKRQIIGDILSRVEFGGSCYADLSPLQETTLHIMAEVDAKLGDMQTREKSPILCSFIQAWINLNIDPEYTHFILPLIEGFDFPVDSFKPTIQEQRIPLTPVIVLCYSALSVLANQPEDIQRRIGTLDFLIIRCDFTRLVEPIKSLSQVAHAIITHPTSSLAERTAACQAVVEYRPAPRVGTPPPSHHVRSGQSPIKIIGSLLGVRQNEPLVDLWRPIRGQDLEEAPRRLIDDAFSKVAVDALNAKLQAYTEHTESKQKATKLKNDLIDFGRLLAAISIPADAEERDQTAELTKMGTIMLQSGCVATVSRNWDKFVAFHEKHIGRDESGFAMCMDTLMEVTAKRFFVNEFAGAITRLDERSAMAVYHQYKDFLPYAAHIEDRDLFIEVKAEIQRLSDGAIPQTVERVFHDVNYQLMVKESPKFKAVSGLKEKYAHDPVIRSIFTAIEALPLQDEFLLDAKIALPRELDRVIIAIPDDLSPYLFYLELYRGMQDLNIQGVNSGQILHIISQKLLVYRGGLEDVVIARFTEAVRNYENIDEFALLFSMIAQSKTPELLGQAARDAWIGAKELIPAIECPVLLDRMLRCDRCALLRTHHTQLIENQLATLLPRYKSLALIIQEIGRTNQRVAAQLQTAVEGYFRCPNNIVQTPEDLQAECNGLIGTNTSSEITLFNNAITGLSQLYSCRRGLYTDETEFLKQECMLRRMEWAPAIKCQLRPADLRTVRQLIPQGNEPVIVKFNGNPILCLPPSWAQCNVKVFGDIHGNVGAVQAIREFLEADENNRVICLGDYIDRGDNLGVLAGIAELKARYLDRLVLLRGNHEQAHLTKAHPFDEALYGDFHSVLIGRKAEQKIRVAEGDSRKCTIPLYGAENVRDPAGLSCSCRVMFQNMPVGCCLRTQDGRAILLTHGALYTSDTADTSLIKGGYYAVTVPNPQSLFYVLGDLNRLLAIYDYQAFDRTTLCSQLEAANCILVCGHSHESSKKGFYTLVNSALFNEDGSAPSPCALMIENGEIKDFVRIPVNEQAVKDTSCSKKLESARKNPHRPGLTLADLLQLRPLEQREYTAVYAITKAIQDRDTDFAVTIGQVYLSILGQNHQEGINSLMDALRRQLSEADFALARIERGIKDNMVLCDQPKVTAVKCPDDKVVITFPGLDCTSDPLKKTDCQSGTMARFAQNVEKCMHKLYRAISAELRYTMPKMPVKPAPEQPGIINLNTIVGELPERLIPDPANLEPRFNAKFIFDEQVYCINPQIFADFTGDITTDGLRVFNHIKEVFKDHINDSSLRNAVLALTCNTQHCLEVIFGSIAVRIAQHNKFIGFNRDNNPSCYNFTAIKDRSIKIRYKASGICKKATPDGLGIESGGTAATGHIEFMLTKTSDGIIDVACTDFALRPNSPEVQLEYELRGKPETAPREPRQTPSVADELNGYFAECGQLAQAATAEEIQRAQARLQEIQSRINAIQADSTVAQRIDELYLLITGTINQLAMREAADQQPQPDAAAQSQETSALQREIDVIVAESNKWRLTVAGVRSVISAINDRPADAPEKDSLEGLQTICVALHFRDMFAVSHPGRILWDHFDNFLAAVKEIDTNSHSNFYHKVVCITRNIADISDPNEKAAASDERNEAASEMAGLKTDLLDPALVPAGELTHFKFDLRKFYRNPNLQQFANVQVACMAEVEEFNRQGRETIKQLLTQGRKNEARVMLLTETDIDDDILPHLFGPVIGTGKKRYCYRQVADKDMFILKIQAVISGLHGFSAEDVSAKIQTRIAELISASTGENANKEFYVPVNAEDGHWVLYRYCCNAEQLQEPQVFNPIPAQVLGRHCGDEVVMCLLGFMPPEFIQQSALATAIIAAQDEYFANIILLRLEQLMQRFGCFVRDGRLKKQGGEAFQQPAASDINFQYIKYWVSVRNNIWGVKGRLAKIPWSLEKYRDFQGVATECLASAKEQTETQAIIPFCAQRREAMVEFIRQQMAAEMVVASAPAGIAHANTFFTGDAAQTATQAPHVALLGLTSPQPASSP